MTSLAHQLKRLALPQSDPNLLTRREVASLLFDPKDAATMDRSTFFALGCTGLEELLGFEPAFLEFQDTLFSSSSVTLERSVQSREVNNKLDTGISLFLTRLCPYFLLKPAHKCIEWLVHRFHIQLYNADSLLACALPYHDTNIFVRVLQLINIKEPTNHWNWLHCLQKPGVPLSRGSLIMHLHTDLSFMDFICSMVTRSIQAFSGYSFSQLRVVFSFYASTVVPALAATDRVSEHLMAKLLPYIQLGLNSILTDYKAATYMIVCQLAVKVVMERGVVNSLAVHVGKSLLKEPALVKEGLGCLIVLLQSQKDGAVGPRAVDHLCSLPSLASVLQVMATTYDVSPLLRYLLPQLICSTFSAGEVEAGRLRVLESVLKSVPLNKDLDQTLARLLIDQYLSQSHRCADDMSALDQLLLPIIRLFENRYSKALDAILAARVCSVSNLAQKQLFNRFLSLSTRSGKHQILGNSDVSLFLSLRHPEPSVRMAAVECLKDLVATGQHVTLDETFLKEAILERLKDEAVEVVAAALTVLQMVLDKLEPEDCVSCLLSLVHRTDLSGDECWLPVLTSAVHLLSDQQLLKRDHGLLEKTGWRLLPFLVITSPQLGLPNAVAHSSVLAQHPLTHNWGQELNKMAKMSHDPNFVGMANDRLISTLARNLTNMEPFCKRDALEKLVLLVEQQLGSSLRARASFVVLTRTLLLSLDGLSETQHLLTSQRIYMLLEAPLLEVTRSSNTPEMERPASDPLSFSEAVTLCLSSCGRQENEALLVALLRDFVFALKCPDVSLSGEVWWNPEKFDANTCCYLGLICRLFTIIISGAAEGRRAGSFRELMKLLIEVHFREVDVLFRFLSMLWGYDRNHGDQLDVKVGAILQMQALYMGGILLSTQPPAVLEELTNVDSPVVPSLLCCLTSPVCEVRRTALDALQNLSKANNSPFQPITAKLLKTSEEILADASYLNTALGVLYKECLSSKTELQRLELSLQPLLQSIQTPSCPSYSASAVLQALSLINGQSILSTLLPALDRLLQQAEQDGPYPLQTETQLLQLILRKYNQESAQLLARNPKCLDLFTKALRHPSCQITALEQITKPFFSALADTSVQQKLLSEMFNLLQESCSPMVTSSIGSVFKAISVDAQLLANELAPTEKPRVVVTVQQTRRTKASQRKPQDNTAEGHEGCTVSWQKVTLILELLQHKKKLKRAQMLVPVLFSLLSRSLEPQAGNHGNMEYTKQLLLSCLLNICLKMVPESAGVTPVMLDEDKFSVELVVHCIRVSEMPQTHHQALLLLSTVATIFPEKVLHNIMPIFTFMGASVMRLDDAYSFCVIDKTVQMVVPALIRACRLPDGSSSPHLVGVVTKIMHVFVDALPHVPEHRRLPLLTQLVTTLGPSHFLWVLLMLLLKLHATHSAAKQSLPSASERDATLERDVDFWILLCCQFKVSDQLISLINALKFLLQLPDDKNGGETTAALKRAVIRREAKKEVEKEEKLEELVFNVEAHSSKELRHFKFVSVSFMAQLLSSSSFIQKVADHIDEGEDDSQTHLQQLQQQLLEENLCYINSVARCVEENADKHTAKFWRVLLNKTYEVLDKVNALLPTNIFITVMQGLMGNQLASVRRKAMELLNNKLQQRTQWNKQQVTVLLELISDLLRVVGRGQVSEEEEAEQTINRQTALYSLKLLCHNIGSHHQEAFVPVLLQAVEVITVANEEKNVTASALLCIAEVVSTLKALAIPQLPRLMPAVLHVLMDRKDLLTNETYLLSGVTALQRVIDTLPHFISPYLQDSTSQVCRLTRMVETSSSSSSSSYSQLCTRLAALRSTLATKLPSRVFLPTLTKCYSSMVDSRRDQLGVLMSIMKEHISQMQMEQLSFHQSELTTFFLTALDFRAKHCPDDLQKASEVEGSVIECLLTMVMKLSEFTFRPLFFKLCDWSKADSAERQLTFFRLCDVMASRLKRLFVLFATQLVKPLAAILRQTSSSDELPFQNSEKNCLLLQLGLNCLQKIFLYDTKCFLNQERADALLSPLVEQLENQLGGEQVYQQRVTQHLLPCLGQFSVALADDSLWKTLNYEVLLKTRHGDSKVRFSSLLMLMELAFRLKENYVVLLPETIPFLAELMEDECEEVQQQVQRVVQEMEKILGQPLQSYF
ncbi:HEAT repeat-containing protein 1 isoform X1 [Oryzias melastigma]|uniref:HEAT repeat-containing protein 1 isoform X1 n=1 Tax=Oryzias melastigma TaxID=30732 RepID=UPI000CF7F294|nr:HEAT repeat-containing protein 1 isoform X1 [Oryzias melastigma]XP_024117300.1 HEAT repeat-containing protein 1 isoform X1 [Oryzias melastigma]